jgi:hypothetical protein
MKQKPKGCSRRDFFKTTGAVGIGALLTPLAGSAQAGQVERLPASKDAKVPTRPFGKSGIDVSILYGEESNLGDELAARFMKKGLTQEQARLKAVWTDRRISSLCSQMPGMNLLKANVAAAVSPETLSSTDMQLLHQYAQETLDQYCTGCGHICETALDHRVPVSDIMRYHMYCQSYGRADWARTQFGTLTPKVRRQLKSMDFSTAEARCPQQMPIARLMRQALEDFS